MFELVKFSINGQTYHEEPLEEFKLFSFENTLEAAQKRILNAVWMPHYSWKYDKAKKWQLAEPIMWSFGNVLIRKTI